MSSRRRSNMNGVDTEEQGARQFSEQRSVDCSGDAAQDVHLFDASARRGWRAGAGAPSASSAPPDRGSRAPRATRCQCVDAGRAPPPRRPATDRACAPATGEAAERLAPVVGDQLHRLRQVERAVARVGRDRSGRRGRRRRRRWPCRSARSRTRRRRGARSRARLANSSRGACVGRPEIARRHRGRADEGDAVERLVPASRRRARAPSTSVAPLAIAIASGRASTSAKRGATSTRSAKPITLIARAAAPTLPAWLVPTRTKRVGSAGHAAAKIGVAHFAARPSRDRGASRRSRSRRYADPLHVASAAPHAQHRHQGGARRRGDHQPGLARPRPAAGQHQGAERLRHRGRPRRRGGRSSTSCSPPIPATASSPRNRAATRGAQATATMSGSSIRSTAPPTSSTACRPTRSRSRLALSRPGPAGRRLRPDAQRPVLRLARAAAPS